MDPSPIGSNLFISKVITPFAKKFSLISTFKDKILKDTKWSSNNTLSRDKIKELINVSEESGVIDEIEKDMIQGVFKFDKKIAREVMTPRIEVFAISIKMASSKVAEILIKEQFSRVPVYEESIDNIIGILYFKDFFEALIKIGIHKIQLRDILRPATFVPEVKYIDDLFKELQQDKTHMAILIDEYGGVSGIVTIEDLIEEVMGNIFDEYDESSNDIQLIEKDIYMVNGAAQIDEINELFNINIKCKDIDTIGGFLINLSGDLPINLLNSKFRYENLTFEVYEVSKKRINKVKIYLNNYNLEYNCS